MKKIIIAGIASVLLFGAANITLATPMLDLSNNNTLRTEILPIEVNSFNTIQSNVDVVNSNDFSADSVGFTSQYSSNDSYSWGNFVVVGGRLWRIHNGTFQRWIWRLGEWRDRNLQYRPRLAKRIKNEWDRNFPSPVPEPATMLLFGTGLVGLAISTRKKFIK